MNSSPRSFDEEYIRRLIGQNKIPPNHPFYRLYVIIHSEKKYHSLRKYDYIPRKVKEVFGNDINGKSILDFGCGSGWLAVNLAKAGAFTIGIDIDKDFVKFARARANHEREENANFVLCDGSHLPFRGQIFNYATAIDALEHVKSLKTCLNEVNRTLKTRGSLYFEVPNRNHLELFHASRTNVRTRLLRWFYKTKGEKIIWFKHGFSDFETLFTYRLIRNLLRKSDFNNFKILRPLIIDMNIIFGILWKLDVIKWFKSNFSVIAYK